MADAEEQDPNAAAPAAGADDNQQDANDLQLSADEQKAQDEAEDFILNFKDEDFNDPVKVAELEKIQQNHKILKTTIHQKNHFRDKVKPPEKPAPAAPAKPAEAAKPGEPAVDPKWDKDAVTDFRLDNPSLPKKVVDSIVKFAKVNNSTLEEAKADPIVQKIIKEQKTTDEVEDASISSSGRRPASGVGSRDWSNATREEIEAERLRISGQSQN